MQYLRPGTSSIALQHPAQGSKALSGIQDALPGAQQPALDVC